MHARIACGVLAASLTFVCASQGQQPHAIPLFNGKDLTTFYTWLSAPAKGQQPLGKNNDPKKVFTVVEEDGKPAIRISGEVWGGLITEKEYENYQLDVVFKWGKITFPPREKAARDSGILLHCTGPDGGYSHWMTSIECQMIEGGTGDILVLGNKDRPYKLTCEVEYKATGDKGNKQPYFKEGGEKREFPGGRINWWGRDPKWEDKLGFRGPQDVEKPVGEWNRLTCICAGDSLEIILNGQRVNRATGISPAKGKILIQSEGAELFVREMSLTPRK
jgi:3-keto-disaccharide hydrolase